MRCPVCLPSKRFATWKKPSGTFLKAAWPIRSAGAAMAINPPNTPPPPSSGMEPTSPWPRWMHLSTSIGVGRFPRGPRPPPSRSPRITAGRYFVSILVEEDIKPLPVVNKQVGLDLGLKSMVITSEGESVGNPQFFRKDEKKLAKASRRLAKKKKSSKNRAKARFKVAKIHARIADRRRDYQHKLSTRIVHENQVICVESLTVKNMLGNHCLAKSISDVGWGEFVRKLEYKAQWYGRTLVKIDKWYPSSKRCSHCGHVLASLSLDERFWMCPECKTFHDRDINAAKNVLAAGLAVSACGEAVRPGRAKARSGRTQRSRKSNG